MSPAGVTHYADKSAVRYFLSMDVLLYKFRARIIYFSESDLPFLDRFQTSLSLYLMILFTILYKT